MQNNYNIGNTFFKKIKVNNVQTVEKKRLMLILPYLGHYSISTKKQLLKLFRKTLPFHFANYVSSSNHKKEFLIIFNLRTKYLNLYCPIMFTFSSVQDATPVTMVLVRDILKLDGVTIQVYLGELVKILLVLPLKLKLI